MTNPTGRVGKAYVEITSDYDKFAREAEVKINAALRKINLDDNPFGSKVSAIGGKVGDAFQKGFEEAVTNEFRAGARKLNERIAASIDNGPSRNRLRSAFNDLAKFATVGFGSAIALVLGGGKGVGSFIDTFKEGGGFLKSLLSSISDSAGNFLIKAGLMVIIIPHLAGVIFTLTGNLVSLVGLLNAIPGVAGIAIGALIPLILSFQNFGEAIGAILDGDPDKINEALKKLAPSARNVAKEFQTLLPQLRDIQQQTQQSFFAPLGGVLTEVFDQIGGGRIAQGFANVAASLGGFAAQFIRLASAPGVQKLAGILFGSESDPGAISRVIAAIGGPVTRLLDGLANAGASTMPTIERLFSTIGGYIDKFATWLNESAESGGFDAFLNSALQTLGDLKDLAFAVFDVFKQIFLTTDEGGERFLQKVTKAVQQLADWIGSEDGQQALAAMVHLAEAFADALGVAVSLLSTILTLLGKVDAATGGGAAGGVGAAIKGKAGTGAALRGYASGGVVNGPTFAMVGEAGPEAVVPLNDPARAAQVMGEAGLVPLAANMMGSAGVNVTVYLGTKQITDILDKRVEQGFAGAAGAVARGGRSL